MEQQQKINAARFLLTTRHDTLEDTKLSTRNSAFDHISAIRTLTDEPSINAVLDMMEVDIQVLCDCFDAMYREAKATLERIS